MKTGNNYSILYKVNNINRSFKLQIDKKINPSTIQAIVHKILTVNHPENLGADQEITFYASTINQNTQLQISYTVGHGNRIYSSVGALPSGEQPPDIQGTTFTIIPTIRNCPSFLKNYTRFIRSNPAAAIIGNIFVFIFIAPAIALYRTLSSSGEERESARITRKQLGALTIDHPIKLRRLLQRRLHQLESIGDSVGASICRESIRSMYLIDQASSSSKKLGNSLDKIMEQVTTSAHPSIIPFWHWDSDHFIPFLTSITRTDPAQPPLVAKYKIQFNRGWAGKEESTELPFETEYSDFTEAQIKHLLHAILITNQARKPQSMSIPGSKSLTDYIRFPEGLVVDEFDIEKFKKITQGGIINIEDYLEKAKKLLLSNDYRTCSQAVFDLAEMIHSQNNPPPPVEPDEKTPLRSFTKGHKPKNGWELVFKGMKNIQGYADRSKFLIDTLNEELTVYLKGFHRLDLSAQELALQQLESHLKDLRELLDEGDLSESRENLSSIASIFSAKIEELKKRRAEVIAKQETTVVSTSTKGLKTEKEPRIGVQVDKKQLPKPQHSKTVDYQPTHVLYKEKLDQLRLAFNNIKPESIGSIEKLYDELLVDLNALLDQGEYQAAYTISLEMQKMIPHINNNPPSFWLSPYFRSQADKLAGNQTHLYFDRINQWSQRITNLTKFQWEASLKLQKFDVAPEVIYQNLKLKGILISLIYNRYLIGKKAENKDDPKTKAALIFEKFNIDLSEMKLILHHPFGALSVEEQQMIEETFLTIEGLAAQHDNGPTTLDTTKLIEFSYDSYVKKWRETHPEPRDDALLVVKANDEIAREGAKKIPTRESNEGEEFLTNELVDFLEFSIYFDTMVSPSNVLFTDFSKRNVGTWSQLAMIEFFHEDERLAKMRDEHLLIVKNRLAKMKRLKIAHIHKVMTHAFLISDPTNSFAAGVSLWHDNSSVSKVTYSKAVYDYEKKQITQSHLTGYDPVAYLGRAARWAQTYIHKEVASICTDSQSYWSIKPTARPYLNRAASTEYSTYETAMRSESTNPVADALLSGTRHVFSPKKYFLEMSEFNLEHALHTIIARPDLIDLDGGVEYLEFLIHQPFAIQKMLKTEKGFDRVVRLVNQLVQITMEKKEGNIHTHCMLLKVIDAIKQTGIRLNVQPDFFQQLPSYYDNEELANFLGTKLRGDDSDVAKYHLIAITVQKLAKNGHDTACLSNSEHKLLFSAVPFLAYVKQRYGIPFKNEEMISYINTAYLPELLKPQNREFLQSFIEPLYRLQESTLDEFVEKTPTFKKFPPIKPNGPWTQIPAKPFLFENGEYQLNIFTGQFTIRGKIAPSTPFEGTLQKKIIDSPLFKRHFDHIPDFIKIRQGATPSEWVYLFKQNGREFEIVSNDESAEFVVRVKIESKDSKYPTTQWFQWMESEEQTGSGIGKAIAEAGIWVSTTNPKKGLYILNRTKNWPKHDFYRINLNGNGEITKMINPHDEIVTADFDLHLASFFRQSDPKNIIFSRHPKGTKLSRVRLTDFPLELELRDQQWHGIGNYSNFMSTYNGEIGTTECQKKSKELFTAIGGTGYDVILRLGDQKQQKWIIWPKKIVRQVGIQKEHTELATVGPVELTINENGQLSGSAATFFYLAYIFFQKKDFKSALQFLNEAKKHPINNDMEQFQEIQKLIRAEPSQSRRSAIFLLKAELFAFNLQTQFVKSIDKVELAQLALSLNNKYQILQVKQGIPATERRNLTTPITSIELKRGEQSLELTREEHRQLIHLFKGANAQLVKDASERSESTKKVTLGTAQTQPALSQNAKGFIIGLTKKAPQTDPEKQELLSAKSLSAVDFIANFLFYYNEIINTHDAEYPFLYVPFRELSSLGKLTPREKKLIAAAQEAQRFLLHVKGSHRDFQPIDINAIIRERKNILPMPVRVNSPGSTVRSLLSGPLKIAGRKISAPFIRLFTDQKPITDVNDIYSQKTQLTNIDKLLEDAHIAIEPFEETTKRVVNLSTVAKAFAPETEYPVDPQQILEYAKKIQEMTNLAPDTDELRRALAGDDQAKELASIDIDLLTATSKAEQELGVPILETSTLKETHKECLGLEAELKHKSEQARNPVENLNQTLRLQNRTLPANLDLDRFFEAPPNIEDQVARIAQITQQFEAKFTPQNAAGDRVLQEEFTQIQKAAQKAKDNFTAKLSNQRTLKRNLNQTREELSAQLKTISEKRARRRKDLLIAIKDRTNAFGQVPELKKIQDRLLKGDLTYNEEQAIFDLLALIQEKHPNGELRSTLELLDGALMQYVKLSKAESHLQNTLRVIERIVDHHPALDLTSEMHVEEITKLYQALKLALDFNRFLDPNGRYISIVHKKIEIQEFKVGVQFRDEQIEAILSFAQNPDQAQAFRMGFGKTFGVLPTLAEIFCDQGRFVVGILPRALKSRNLVEFDEMTRRGYGTRAHPFEISLADELSPSILAQKYKTLLRIKLNGGYILSSRDTFDNIKTMLRSLILQHAQLVDETKDIAVKLENDKSDAILKLLRDKTVALALVKEKISWLSKIENLFNDEKTQFIVDEADSEFDINKTINRSIGDSRGLDPTILDITDQLFDMLLNGDHKEGSKLKILQEKILNGTQSDISPDEFKAEYLPEITKDMVLRFQGQEIIPAVDPSQDWEDYLLGKSDQKPTDYDTVEGQKKERIGALKHILSLSLQNLLMKKIGDHFRASDLNGAIFVPTENGVEVPGVQFGSEYDLSIHNYLGYIQFKFGQSTTPATKEFILDSLKNIQSRGLRQWKELEALCEARNLKPEEMIFEPEAFRIRIFIYREFVLQQGRMQVTESFIKMAAQDSLRGRHASMVTGTLNPYLLPNCNVAFWKEENAPSRLQIEVEVYFNALLKHPQLGQTPVATFSLTKALEYTDGLLAETETIAIINQGGYGMEGLTTFQYVQKLRDGRYGKLRNYIFVDLDQSKTRRTYYWDKESGDPIIFDASAPVPPNTVVIYGMQDTRGTDFKMGGGNIHLLVNPTANQASSSQAIMRGRETGRTQTSIWHKPVAEDEFDLDRMPALIPIDAEPDVLTMTEVIESWVKRSVSDQKVQGEKSAIKRPDDIVQSVVERILFNPVDLAEVYLQAMFDPAELDPLKVLQALPDSFVSSINTKVLSKFFTKKKIPDHLGDFNPSETTDTTDRALASYDEAIESLKKAKVEIIKETLQVIESLPHYSELPPEIKQLVKQLQKGKIPDIPAKFFLVPPFLVIKSTMDQLDDGVELLLKKKREFQANLEFNKKFLPEKTFKGVSNDSGEQEQTQTFTMEQEKTLELEHEVRSGEAGQPGRLRSYHKYVFMHHLNDNELKTYQTKYSPEYLEKRFGGVLPHNGTYSEYIVMHTHQKGEPFIEGILQQDYEYILQAPNMPEETEEVYNDFYHIYERKPKKKPEFPGYCMYRINPRGELLPTDGTAERQFGGLDPAKKKSFIIRFVLFKIEWGFTEGAYTDDEKKLIAEWAKDPVHMRIFKEDLLPKLVENNVHKTTIQYVTDMIEGNVT